MNSTDMPTGRSARSTISVRVDAVLAARIREFVRDNAGKPLYANLSSFTEDALRAHLAAQERKLAEGDARSPSRNSHARH